MSGNPVRGNPVRGDPLRADPFAGDFDLSDFQPRPAPKGAARQEIREVSEAHDFPSRAPARREPGAAPQRRRRTGRNVQFNIKATLETIERFVALADRRDVPFGELLKQLVDAAETPREGR